MAANVKLINACIMIEKWLGITSSLAEACASRFLFALGQRSQQTAQGIPMTPTHHVGANVKEQALNSLQHPDNMPHGSPSGY